MVIDYSTLPNHRVLCIDMKSFYASVECVSRGLNPLNDCLAVVGDTNRHGSVVLAASPMMKKNFGIKTGNRMFEIPKDPSIHIVDARMGYYLDVSVEITKLLNTFAPMEDIHVYSVDEAFLDITNNNLHGDKWQTAKKIIRKIYDDFGLPSCIGIGPNKFLAKVILDIEAKKKWVAACDYEDVQDKLWPVPIKDMWGIGSRMNHNLNRMGIMTVGQLAQYPLKLLKKRFGVMGEELYWHANGVDLSPVSGYRGAADNTPKGFYHGITLLRDYAGEEVKTCILDIAEEVARRARSKRLAGRTISMSIGYSNEIGGGGFSRSFSLNYATSVTMDIYKACLKILNDNYTGEVVRQVHVSLSKLEADELEQLSLFEDRSKQQDIGYVMDGIRDRFGSNAILRASSYTNGGITRGREKVLGGHKA